MRVPLWKKWWSYVSEIHIESAPSELNPILYVSLKNGRYQLCSANAIYSYDDLYKNFDEALAQIDWKKWNPTNVLILGFGLGSIPFLLEKKYQLNLDITGIEVDPSVVYLASKYSLSRLESHIELVNTDAQLYLEMNSVRFDMIIIDVFEDDQIPANFLNEYFLHLTKDNLSEKGIILFNHLYNSPKTKKQTENYFETVFKKIYPKAKPLQVHQNHILINRTDFIIPN